LVILFPNFIDKVQSYAFVDENDQLRKSIAAIK